MSRTVLTSTPFWADSAETLAFARALVAGGEMDGGPDPATPMQNLLYFFEKPWKWSTEYTAWVKAGRPDAYNESVRLLEEPQA